MKTFNVFEPVALSLADGVERKFFLPMSKLQQLMERFGAETPTDFLSKASATKIFPAILFEAQLSKTDRLTEEQIADLIPAHIGDESTLIPVLFALLGHKNPLSPAVPASE